MRYLFVLLLGAVMLSSGCNKELACPEGYGGSNCDTALSPQSIIIKSVTAIRWPSSTLWDAFNAPDPYILVLDSDGNELGRSATILNTTDNPLSWNSVNIIIDFPEEKEFFMAIVDEDDITDDQIMGSYSWFPGPTATLNDFPSTVLLNTSTSDTAFSMEVDYTF